MGFLTNVVVWLIYWPIKLITWLVGWVGKLLWSVAGPPLRWLGERLWPWVRVPLSWLGLSLAALLDVLTQLPRLALWIPYSYAVVGFVGLGAIPLLDLQFEFDLDSSGYLWWAAVWVPLLAAGLSVALGSFFFVILIIRNRGDRMGDAALAGLNLTLSVLGLPGAAWAWLWALLIRFWITKFLLAVAIANGITGVALFIIAVVGGPVNVLLLVLAVVLVLASMTGGYSWANQYGSGFIGPTGLLLTVILFLWGIWVWLCALVVGVIAVAAPFVLLWVLGFILTPGQSSPLFEPFWVDLLVLVLLTGFFAVVPWFLTLREDSLAELFTDDLN